MEASVAAAKGMVQSAQAAHTEADLPDSEFSAAMSEFSQALDSFPAVLAAENMLKKARADAKKHLRATRPSPGDEHTMEEERQKTLFASKAFEESLEAAKHAANTASEGATAASAGSWMHRDARGRTRPDAERGDGTPKCRSRSRSSHGSGNDLVDD